MALPLSAVERLPTIPHKRRCVKRKADVELLTRVFNDPDKDNERLAREALVFVEQLHRRHTVKLLNGALLVKDEEGNVSVTDTRDIDPKKGRVLGATPAV